MFCTGSVIQLIGHSWQEQLVSGSRLAVVLESGPGFGQARGGARHLVILAGHARLTSAAGKVCPLADSEAVTGSDDQPLAVEMGTLGPGPPPAGRAGSCLLTDDTLLLLFETGVALFMLAAAAANAGRQLLLLNGSLSSLLLESCRSDLLLLS